MEPINHEPFALPTSIHTSALSHTEAVPASRNHARSRSPTPKHNATFTYHHMVVDDVKQIEGQQTSTNTDDDCSAFSTTDAGRGVVLEDVAGNGTRIQRKAVQSAQDARLARALHEQWSDRTSPKARKRPRLPPSSSTRHTVPVSVLSVVPLVVWP